MATVVGILDTKLKILSIQELISVRAPKETGLFYKKNTLEPCLDAHQMTTVDTKAFSFNDICEILLLIRRSNAYFT